MDRHASVFLPHRRRLLQAAAASALVPALGGCGFQLRQAPVLPFATVQLAGFSPNSPLGDALRNAIANTSSTRVVDGPQAQVVLRSVLDIVQRSTAVSTSFGQVREIQIRARFRFILSRPDGRELIPEAEIVQVRDLTYNERDALAKEQEEYALYGSMQADIAAQVLRRLAAVKMPAD